MIQQTLVLVKPDGVQRGLIGEVIKRFENRGLKIVGMKLIKASKELGEKHYDPAVAERHGDAVRQKLISYVTESPVVALVIQGINAVPLIRKIVGSTYPGEADLGTIRGDYAHTSKEYTRAMDQGKNLIHASEDEEYAKREISFWFTKEELFDYKLSHEDNIY
jgi:nucleoside-diphosphate kinase